MLNLKPAKPSNRYSSVTSQLRGTELERKQIKNENIFHLNVSKLSKKSTPTKT